MTMEDKRNRYVCSICQDRFTKPKIISCFHTFCEDCLGSHIEETAENSCFLCPVCRTDIVVPKGGVAKFSPNFYIEEETEVKPQEKRRSCTEHETEELDFYCETCTEIICIKCLMSNHKDHKTPQLKDCEEAVKMELTKLQTELEEQYTKIDRYVASIVTNVTVMRESKTETCKKIDEQVQKICDAVTALGNESKKEVETTCDEEEQKMNKIIEKMKNATQHMEATIEHLKHVLKKNSVGENIKVLPEIRSEKAEKCSTDLACLPHVVTEYRASMVNLAGLSGYLGELSILRGPTFQHKFRLSKHSKRRTFESTVYRVEDLSWFLRIATRENSDLVNIGVYLYLGDQPALESVTTRIKLELLRASDRKRLGTKEDTKTFTGLIDCYRWNDVPTKTFILNTSVPVGFGSTPFTNATVGGLCGSSNPVSNATAGGRFGSSAPVSKATAGGLFGGSTPVSKATAGGLFGGSTPVSKATAGGLFGISTPVSKATAGGLFGTSTPVSNAPAGELFGGSTPVSNASAGLLFAGSNPVSNTTAGGRFGSSAPVSIATAKGLFAFGSCTPVSNATTGLHFSNCTPVSNATAGGHLGSSTPVSNATFAGMFGGSTHVSNSTFGGRFSGSTPVSNSTAEVRFGGSTLVSNSTVGGRVVGSFPVSRQSPSEDKYFLVQANVIIENTKTK
ncbi:uncharacterized protein LOC126819435 [Patella vulgata]|uniref:uncharacterized protein LOC126819435 n=1 Tax=Patella vulgata TaxID=6465 RepID=UPI0024A7BD93|nr:uncharacterized protein LOC126819435 [Patella vulgata]